MHIILRSNTGVIREAILAAGSSNTLRVIVPGAKDALELTLGESKWQFADGEAVEIEALVAVHGAEAFYPNLYPRSETRVLTAGSFAF